MKTITLFVLGLIISIYSNGQDTFKCGISGQLNKLYNENPQLAKDHEILLKNSLSNNSKSTAKNDVFTIPVVFHIIHNYGSENISDQQILNQMEILNRDFRLLNSDTSAVINEFKGIYADAQIEFKLATIDPSGNCTNGIDRIYSHETFVGDDYSKLNQWPRFNYLNIWVVAQMENGVAGYAYYPTAVEGMGFFRDGIIILDNYIGSIGTGSINNSRALTHEIGHFLGLAHPWGSTNEPGVTCGDDFIPDTPTTRGSNLVCNLSLSECTPGVIENVQNYMDYSYCSRMFTLDQVTAMRNIIQGVAGQRNQLITQETAQLTGIDLTAPPVCVPIADFHANTQFQCTGSSIIFSDESFNGPVTFREWTFYDGGEPSTSTEATPSVVYNSQGAKKVRLIVGNSSGVDTLIRYDFIQVRDAGSNLFGPQSFDFNTEEDLNQFTRLNLEENHAQFAIVNNVGIDNTSCYKLNNYFDNSIYFPLSEEGQYYNRLGGSIDELITPAINLSTTTNAVISFKYSYSTNAVIESNITEALKIYSSKNCGQSWQLRKTITGAELLTMGFAGYTDRAPSNNNEWKTGSFNYNSNSTDIATLFKFQFVASDFAGNFYIDNINIDGTLDVHSLESDLELSIYPNPSKNNEIVSVNYVAGNFPVTFILRDVQGKEIKTYNRPEINSVVSFDLNSELLAPSCYFLEITSNGYSITKKLMIL